MINRTANKYGGRSKNSTEFSVNLKIFKFYTNFFCSYHILYTDGKMFNDNDLVLSKLQELIKCHLGDEKPSSELLIKLFRLLRISNQIPENHCAAVKQKIKQYILSETSTNVPENVSLVRFDKSCDLIIQYQSNAKILNSFLLVLEPFCGQQMQHNTSILSKPTQIPIHKSRFDSIDYLKGSVKTLQVDNIDSIDNRKHQDNIDRSLGFNFDKQSEMEVIQSLLYIFQVPIA